MDKRFIIGVCTGMAILGIITYFPTIAEAIYSVPPTNAWQTIVVDSNSTIASLNQTNITAISYKDTLFLVSDGSINITLGVYP